MWYVYASLMYSVGVNDEHACSRPLRDGRAYPPGGVHFPLPRQSMISDVNSASHFYPQLVPGHEIVGTIHSVGKDVKGFSTGDRVVADNTILCVTQSPYSIFLG
jgi:hypothetical protein